MYLTSIAVTNPAAADGGNAGDTTEEIRQNTLSAASAQHEISYSR